MKRRATCKVCGSALRWNDKLKFMSCPNYYYHNKAKPFVAVTPRRAKPEPIARPNYLAFTPSPQQETLKDAVIELLEERKLGKHRTIAVEGIARAGTGKTTTALLTAAHVRKLFPAVKIGYAAFNRAAADEAAAKAPEGVIVNTLHSLLGRAAIQAAYPDSKIDARKPWKLAEALLPKDLRDDANERMQQNMRKAAVKVYDLVLGQLVNSHDPQAVLELCGYYGIEWEEFGAEPFTKLVREMVDLSMETIAESMSFADMLAAPLMCKAVYKEVPRFDLLIADEAQDMNLAQQALVLVAVGFTPEELATRFGLPRRRKFGVLLYIGDDRQAIYAFRGALREGLDNFYTLARSSGADILSAPLNRTRRCPVKVVELAQRVVPDFEAEDEAPEGAVYTVDMDQVMAHIGTGRDDTLFVSRTNAALAITALKLVKQDIPVEFISRDVGESISGVARAFLYRFREAEGHEGTLVDFIQELRMRIDKILMQAKGKALKARAEQQLDEYDVLIGIAAESSDWHDFFSSINKLFNNDRAASGRMSVKFSTIHAIKGGEAPYVVMVGGDKMPHPLAELEWEQVQEENLFYVAITRAQQELWFLGSLPAYVEDVPIEQKPFDAEYEFYMRHKAETEAK